MKLRGTSKQSQRSRARGTKARERKTSDELGDHGFLLEESHESMSHSWRKEVGEEKEVVEDSAGPGKAEKDGRSQLELDARNLGVDELTLELRARRFGRRNQASSTRGR